MAALRAQITNMKRKLGVSTQQVHRLEATSSVLNARLLVLEPALQTSEISVGHLETRVHDLEEKNKSLFKTARAARRRANRHKISAKAVQRGLDLSQDERMRDMRTELKAANDHATNMLAQLNESIRSCDSLKEDQGKRRLQLQDSRKKIRALQNKCSRAPGILAKAVAKARQKCHRDSGISLHRKIISKGVYTSEARALMRTLVKSGCAPSMVGKVMRAVGGFAGLRINCTVSRRTIQRAILEGGIAARIQLGYEISQAKGNFSGFSVTSHGY